MILKSFATAQRRVTAIAGATAVVAATFTITGSASSAFASGECAPAEAPPIQNTWTDPEGNYRGTRLAHREQVYNLATDVYETYGHGYRQIEVWNIGGSLPPQLVECHNEPGPVTPEPETPQLHEGGGGWETGVSYPNFGGGMIFWVPSVPNINPRVTVGEPVQIQ